MRIEELPLDTVEQDELQDESIKLLKRPSPFISLTWDDWFDMEARLTHFFGAFELAAEHNQLEELLNCALGIFTVAIKLQIEINLRYSALPKPAVSEKPFMTNEQMSTYLEYLFDRPSHSTKVWLEALGL